MDQFLQSVFFNTPPIQVIAPSGQPAFAFSVGGADTATSGGVPINSQAQYTLIANGLSEAPTFSGLINTNSASGTAYVNTAGVVNTVSLFHDGVDGYYFTYPDSGNLATYPSPTAFAATHNTTTLTVTFAGVALSTSSVPPLSAFGLTAVRPVNGGQAQAPYTLAGVAVLSGTSVGFSISGGTFQTGDIVSLSYWPCTRTATYGPLQDAATGQNKPPGWVNAPVTIE